jgi:hypothetical protein
VLGGTSPMVEERRRVRPTNDVFSALSSLPPNMATSRASKAFCAAAVIVCQRGDKGKQTWSTVRLCP